MSAVSGGDSVSLRGAEYYAAVNRSGDVQALTVTTRTAKVFNQQFGKLNSMRAEATHRGEVVLGDRVSLEFETQGLLLSARRGEALFTSAEARITRARELEQAAKQREAEARAAQQPKAPEPAPAAEQPATARGPETTVRQQDTEGREGESPPRLDALA